MPIFPTLSVILSSQLGFDAELQNYMVAASLTVSGILSCAQMTRWRVPFTNYYYGTGSV